VGCGRSKVWAAFAAILVMMAIAAAPAQAKKGAYWGTYIRAQHGETQLHAMHALEDQIGRRFHAFRLYHALNNTNLKADVPAEMRARGVPIYLNVSSELGRTCVPWRAVARKHYNGWLHLIARRIKHYRHPVFFSWNHEPLDKCSDGTAADYVASYHRVHKLFRHDHVRNVVYVWTATAHDFSQDHNTIRKYEPRRYDMVGVDGYNTSGTWRSAKDIFGAAHKFAVNHGKRFMIGEVGSDEDPNDATAKASWYANAAATFKAWGVRMVVWTNAVTAHGDYWATTSAQSLAAYAAAGQLRYYRR
jgi:hypothetical protein